MNITYFHRSCFTKISPTPIFGEAIQVINGKNRRFSENSPNIWQPQTLPAHITLEWNKPVSAKQIRITFDTLERTAHEMPYECNKRASDQCVKKYKVQLFNGKAEVMAVSEENNHNRLAVLNFKETSFNKLTVTPEEL